MSLKFQTKAQNLANLTSILKGAKIAPLIVINKQDLDSSSCETLNKIKKFIESNNIKKLIIRSSSINEDSKTTSNAGAFLSIANIDSSDEGAIKEALNKVAESMPNKQDEILIQSMLSNVKMCGVAFSVDKDNFSPYYCIEYDKSGSTHSITDGSAKNKISFFSYRESDLNLALKENKLDSIQANDNGLNEKENLNKVISLIQELESIFNYQFLDIEFAVCDDGLYCLQVRPLVESGQNLFNSLPKIALTRLQKRFANLQKARLGVYGKKSIFGVMPDWNPAEIIGLKPKRLALSLYKEIVTDKIWAYQRDNYGYLKLRSHPLMHSFLGMPFIDVRLSFNSFIPKSLDSSIAQKLVDYYLSRLESKPHLHDKVEFDIVFSCYDFNTPNKLKHLLDSGFSELELKRLEFALLELTNEIIKTDSGLYLKDLEKVKKLAIFYDEITESNLPLIDKIYWLLEECKRYGTLPFAGIARAGFIAMQMLNSLVEIGFFSQEQKNEFLNSLNTISKQLSNKVNNLNNENKDEFLKEFGHLRAGTYNILSPRYDEAFNEYFEFSNDAPKKVESKFVIDENKEKQLNKMFIEHGLRINAKEFFIFIKTAIEGRESAKFEFSKLLSKAISFIGDLGEYYEISKEDMAHLDIHSILSLYSSLYFDNPKKRFMDEIEQNKKEYDLTLALKLPSLLKDKDEIFNFFSLQDEPNFITQKSIIAKTALESSNELNEKIVLIHAADPGYDYLFSKNIAGLITCYGGANSHMAIRASELGLPAAIGVGEKFFKELLNAKRIQLDCQSKKIICL